MEGFKFSTDPESEAKIRDVVGRSLSARSRLLRGVAEEGPGVKMSFDFRVGLFRDSPIAAKQLITLATAVVALTITFFKDFAGVNNDAANVLMAVSWVFYLLSIVAGTTFLYALTAELEPPMRPRPRDNGDAAGTADGTGSEDPPPKKAQHTPTINNETALSSAGAQQVTFAIGLVLSVIAGAVAL